MKKQINLILIFIIPIIININIVFAATFADATEQKIASKTVPKRIVSLAPNITEELFTLGAGKKIVGVTSYCKYPKQAQQKVKVGAMFSPSIERILSLDPDLVLATKEDNNKKIIYKLRELGVKVYVFKETESYQDIKDNFLRLGVLVDKTKKAEKIIRNIDQKLSRIKKSLTATPKVFFQISQTPIYTVSQNSYINDIIEFAGGKNIVINTKQRYPKYNVEEVIKQDPDFIFIADMSKNIKDVTIWSKYKNLKAVKREQVIKLDPDKILRPTPKVFMQAIKNISSILKNTHK